ncbi:hypothetical protein [Pseudomonas sp. PD9R]|uniref:hypothetical protein n=1 Tax=Pseudomonas sp. PD9R TaxID=2853534 RepID=UPI001C4371B0|nr:hypothetical protein [Pseudomonas sp. PD9R]MBV6825826.1 hypothetical protein [Pseudomonas sp. PD9R]
MHRYYLWIAVLFFIGAWFCLFSVGIKIPENPNDLSDTRGLPAVMIYAVALQVIGVVAIFFTGLGAIAILKLKHYSLGMHRIIFFSSNLLLLLTSFFGIFIIFSFVLDTVLGMAGVILYVGVIGLTLSSTPRRNGS